MLVMNEEWRKWWAIIHGKNTPAGSYNPLEARMYEAWVAAWKALEARTCPPCNGNCNQGRECPARDQHLHNPTASSAGYDQQHTKPQQ